jgi:hypothetical protein
MAVLQDTPKDASFFREHDSVDNSS